ncbi:hypothetical protein [Sinorhizobium sp. BJ1]|uniref:hypothetical protein n=1 Tax=Sinorhizobium sp. BJ1 TaxID=2035455 RepID=UPI0015CF28C4|nr:hypothetical protein [Sinorhizobium sp. BJ1]
MDIIVATKQVPESARICDPKGMRLADGAAPIPSACTAQTRGQGLPLDQIPGEVASYG